MGNFNEQRSRSHEYTYTDVERRYELEAETYDGDRWLSTRSVSNMQVQSSSNAWEYGDVGVYVVVDGDETRTGQVNEKTTTAEKVVDETLEDYYSPLRAAGFTDPPGPGGAWTVTHSISKQNTYSRSEASEVDYAADGAEGAPSGGTTRLEVKDDRQTVETRHSRVASDVPATLDFSTTIGRTYDYTQQGEYDEAGVESGEFSLSDVSRTQVFDRLVWGGTATWTYDLTEDRSEVGTYDGRHVTGTETQQVSGFSLAVDPAGSVHISYDQPTETAPIHGFLAGAEAAVEAEALPADPPAGSLAYAFGAQIVSSLFSGELGTGAAAQEAWEASGYAGTWVQTTGEVVGTVVDIVSMVFPPAKITKIPKLIGVGAKVFRGVQVATHALSSFSQVVDGYLQLQEGDTLSGVTNLAVGVFGILPFGKVGLGASRNASPPPPNKSATSPPPNSKEYNKTSAKQQDKWRKRRRHRLRQVVV